ncbi:MAG: GyrI-like domain-containing protein [Bacteroidales bacterium]|nr:GyrI-like domain-containing protein [Bacteroidales bacterium]
MAQTPRHCIRKRQDTIYNNRRNILINYWISAIRLPDFVTQEDFDWAVAEATRKKKIDCSRAELLKITEGECVQILHIGSYDDEPASVALMDDYLKANHYQNDLIPTRLHHEIYLSDPRKTAVEKLKTVIRHPAKKG